MIATTRFRYVERTVPINETIGKRVRILQQWWAIEREGQVTPTGEWRDIPLEQEA